MKKRIFKVFNLLLVFLSLSLICVGFVSLNNQTQNNKLYAATLPSYYNSTEEIYTKTVNQGFYGMCWDYTACGTVEAVLAKQYGINIDISESWITLFLHAKKDEIAQAGHYILNPHTIGGGSDPAVAIFIMNHYGFFLEEDFPTVSGFNNENASEIVAFYQNSDKLLKLSDLGLSISCSSSEIKPDTQEEINTIKQQIYNYGAVPASIYHDQYKYTQKDGKLVYSNTSTQKSNHAVRVVGWDDNFLGGSFIYRNSHGSGSLYSNEEFYIAYSNYKTGMDLNMKSISVTKNIDYSIISSSTALQKDNPSSNNYYKNTKNLFYSGQPIEISYTSNDFDGKQIKVLRENKDVSSLFTIEYNNASQTVKITSRKDPITNSYLVTSGAFVVKISTTNTTTPELTTIIQVLDGLEMLNNTYRYNKLTYCSTRSSIYMATTNFSLISEEPVIASSNNIEVALEIDNVTYATTSNYASGTFKFSPKVKENKSVVVGEYFTVTYTTLINTQITYTFYVVFTDKNESFSYSYAHYNIEQECDLYEHLPETLYFDTKTNQTFLPKTKSLTKEIVGWQLIKADGSFETLPIVNGYSILNKNQTTEKTGANFIDEKDTISYVKLKPMWEEFGYEITFNMPNGCNINDNNHPRVISKNATDKSYTFKIEAKEGFNISNFKVSYINGQYLTPINASTNEYKIDNVNQNIKITITCDISIIAPTKIEFNTTNNINKTYDGQNTTLTVQFEYNFNTNFTAYFIWYKNSVKYEEQELQKSKTSSINLKNVIDSGSYSCDVYISIDGVNSARVKTPNNISVSIAMANVEVEIIDCTITYGDELSTTQTKDKYKVISGSIYNDDDLQLVFVSNYTKTTNAGTVCSIEANSANNPNYNVYFTKNSASLTVTKRKIKVKAKDITIKKGDKLNYVSSNSYEIIEGSLVNNDKLNLLINCNVKQDSPAGKYTIAIKLDENASNYSSITNNYDIELVNGTYTIKHKTFYYIILAMRIWCFVEFGIILIIILKKSKKSGKKFNKSEKLGYNYNGRK